MPEMKFSEVKHNLALKFAERGIVLTGRKLKDVASIFAERVRRNAAGIDDMDQYVLEYCDPTGEEAILHATAQGCCRFCGTDFDSAATAA